MKTNSEQNSVRVALVGYGRMGREIERLAPAENVEIVSRFSSSTPLSIEPDSGVDAAIEFTHPDAVVANIRTLVKAGVPVVVGTTGWLGELDLVTAEVEASQGRVLYASNFSIGVNLFFRIVAEAARLVDAQPMYDVALNEIHHTGKADSPSGTALTAARIVLEGVQRKSRILAEPPSGRITPESLHVGSLRLGSTIGTHSLLLDSEADSIEITHTAKNRSGFALGALLAARWIVGQAPGIYRFEDIF